MTSLIDALIGKQDSSIALMQPRIPTNEDAMRQGRYVLQITGKLPCTIMNERAEMLGYLREMARTDPKIAEFVGGFEK